MKARISDEVREQVKAEPDTMKYTAIAKKYGISDATVNAIRGPRKGRGKHKRLPPPSTALAKRGEVIELDPPEQEDDTVYVDCQISVPQLDKVYNLLTPRQKALAVLTGLDED